MWGPGRRKLIVGVACVAFAGAVAAGIAAQDTGSSASPQAVHSSTRGDTSGGGGTRVGKERTAAERRKSRFRQGITPPPSGFHAKADAQLEQVKSCLKNAGYSVEPTANHEEDRWWVASTSLRTHRGAYFIAIAPYRHYADQWIEQLLEMPGGPSRGTYKGTVALVPYSFKSSNAPHVPLPPVNRRERAEVAACAFSVPAALGQPKRASF
jgi:hypothetical protein